MILKKYRFHGFNSLRHVYSKGKTFRAGPLALKVADNPHKSEYRLAVVVSKKVSKSAVKRNRIRRRLFEAVRLQSPHFQTQADMVLTVFDDSVLSIPAADVQQLVIKLLQDASIV